MHIIRSPMTAQIQEPPSCIINYHVTCGWFATYTSLMSCPVPISAHSSSMKLLAAEKQPSIHPAPICTNVNDQKRKREALPKDVHAGRNCHVAGSEAYFSLRALITQRLVNDTQLWFPSCVATALLGTSCVARGFGLLTIDVSSDSMTWTHALEPDSSPPPQNAR